MAGPLDDLFGGNPPTSLRDLIDRFTTDGVTSTPFVGGTQHSGTLRSLQTDPIELGFGELELPGITAGTPFRLAFFDAPTGRFHLDIVLNGLSLKLRDLHGADFIKEAGTTPRRLIRKTTDTAVVISGEATIRFLRASASDPVIVQFVDDASAVDPLATTGAVLSLRCNPPHFFFGTSEFGMTLSQLLYDASSTFSPQFITNAGQPAAWMGFAIAEATFYAPPNALGQGGFSGGVRNLLIGSPRGVQGELELQWGRAPLDPATFSFSQDGAAAVGATGTGDSRMVAITATNDDSVEITASFVASNPPEGGTVADWSAVWRWPDGSETEGDASVGQIGHGQILRVTPREVIPGQPVISHPEISFRFAASGEIPEIDVITAGTSIINAVHVTGPAADIADVFFRARSNAPAAGIFKWKLGDGPEQNGVSIQLPLAELIGDKSLILTEELGTETRKARLRVQVAEGVALLVGGEDGIADASTPAVKITPAAVEGTYDLTDFHSQGAYSPVDEAAEIDAGSTERVDVPDGALAIVTIASGGALPSFLHDRHVALEFEFNEGTALRWAERYHPAAATAGGSATDLHRQLLQWANNYPGANFLVVGRCDDLGSDNLNRTLANTRKHTILDFLTVVPAGSSLGAITASRITAWGEQDGQPASVTTSPLDTEERDNQRLILATDDGTGVALTDRTGWPTTRQTSHASEAERERFRRVDVYAVGGTPSAGAVVEELLPGRAPDLRRVMMPGEPIDPVPAPTSTPASDYRVRLLVGWDRPTGDGWKDLIPSKAEFEVAWSPDDHPLPTLGGDPVTLEVLTVYGSWRHDDTTGFTRTQLGIRSDGDPDGLIKTDQPNLVAAMALGPVLLSGVNPGTDTIEKAGRITALAAASAFAQVDLGGGPLVGPDSKAIVKSLEANAEIRDLAAAGDAYKVSLVSDYSTVLHINTGRLGLSTAPENPVKFRYKKVGIEFDSTKTDIWDKIGLAYPTDALEIEDPGRWQIDGVLGELLRAVETALGTGSLWIETRFAFALSIGVVEITEAVIRVTFTDNPLPEFSLRGLVARVDVPATVKGEGRLRIEDPGGVIKAGLDLEIIPLKVKASAAFAMASFTTPFPFTFINLFAKVQFPVGIPLANSGAAIYGFSGQTVINGTRDVVASNDVVQREIGWWMKLPEDKYKPLNGQHALGFGAVVGTLPDASFSLSAQGMIVVAFPDVEVIFGVEVNLLQIPDKTAKEQGGNQNATIIGLIVINDEAVSLAVAARYEIPKILKLVVPFSAYFPYSGNGVYVRIGTDNQPGRPGEAVTLTLLPDTLNLRAFAYLMIEQAGLPNLGGRPDFSFDGFSIGFGAGAGLEWRAGPIKLSASVLLLAGFGTDPLLIKAGIFVKGELNLVVISVAATGEIILTYQNGNLWLDGEFCGRVNFFFFSVSGCVKFRIGNPSTAAMVPPPPPIASISLVDRNGRIMGEAKQGASGALAANPLFRMEVINGETRNTGVNPKDNHTVWADTAPVINFRHFIEDAIPNGRQFNPAAQPSGERWFGSNRLKYSYRLDEVRLVRDSDNMAVSSASGALKSVWMHSPARQPGSSGPTLPSGAEVQSLMLLDWQPWMWALPMADGGASQPGDPATTIGNLCEPIPVPNPACLFGQDARAAGLDRIRLLHETPPPGPYPSRFTLTGRPAMRVGNTLVDGTGLATVVAALGGIIVPGAVTTLAQPVTGPSGPLNRGYRLPIMQIAQDRNVRSSALPWRADIDRTVRRGRLLLLVCDGETRRDNQRPHDCFDFAGVPIGKSYAALQVPGYRLVGSTRGKFTVTDEVALAQGGAISGADRMADIRIHAPGLEIKPDVPAREYELQLFRTDGQEIRLSWVDDQGKKYKASEPAGQNGSLIVALSADHPIIAIKIAIKTRTVHLYRICSFGDEQSQRCFEFDRLTDNDIGRGTFDYEGVSFASADPNARLRLVDLVDTSANPAVRGADRKPELNFSEKGVELQLSSPTPSISIGVASYGGEVSLLAFDAAGALVARAQDPARDPVMITLAGPGIVRVIVSGGSNEAVIYRVCLAAESAGTAGECRDFTGASAVSSRRIDHGGMTFAALAEREKLALVDAFGDNGGAQIDPRGDGRPELRIPRSGLMITPEVPLAMVRLYLVTLGGERAEAIAYDEAGRQIAQASGGGVDLAVSELLLEGVGIVRVELKAGGKSFLTRFCTAAMVRSARASQQGRTLPVVDTRQGTNSHAWTPHLVGSVMDAGGNRCRLIRYDQPGTVQDADNFEINAGSANLITLLSFCAIDSAAFVNRTQDQQAQTDLADAVSGAAGGGLPPLAREILLDPGQRYRIEVDWSWRGWVSNEDGTDSPPGSPEPAWQTGGTERYRFKVADEDLTIGETQDGLNEFKFDPRDIARYLSRTEPADGRDVVFTDDPLWVHFMSGHVEALVDRYGRELILAVRRTDPPPQPTPAAMELAVFPELLEVIRAIAPSSTQSVTEQRINAAVLAAPCLPNSTAVGGATLGSRFRLEPNAMYDFNLIARKKGISNPALADPVVVNATRFITSRYANPAEMLAGLGFPTTGQSPFAPQEIILAPAAVLPSGPLIVSDLELGAALAAIGADTLPLPDETARVIALWRPLAGGGFGVAGILVDAPEPMRREAAVLQGQQAVDSVRCEPQRLAIGATHFLPVRATLNWTRVLFVPSGAPVTPVDEAILQFRFGVGAGATLTGERTINSRPTMLETEGF